jgi:DNA primase
VVEGYMDVVSLFQFGVDTAVATLGTATTPDHAELLFRNAADVYFCFDGDRAGRGAAWKALESVLPRMREGRQAFFLFLPEGEDPDTIVRKEGAAGFDARLAQATPLSEVFWNELAKDVNLAGMEGKARLAERAKPLLAQIPDGAFGDLMKQRLTELTGVGRRDAPPPPQAAPSTTTRSGRGSAPAPKISLVRSVIGLLLQKPALADAIEPPYLFGTLRQPGIPLLMEMIELARTRPGLTTGAVLEHFAGREEEGALHKLALQDLPGDEKIWRQEIADAAAQLDRQARQQRIEELHARLSELAPHEKDELRDLLSSRR